MELFKIFSNDIHNQYLCCPLNHPNIKYGWLEKKVKINGKDEIIQLIGTINFNKESSIEFNGTELGFFDQNNNFITPIFFHEINLKKEGYKILFDKTKQLSQSSATKSNIEDLVNMLDTDSSFFWAVVKYERNQNFEDLKGFKVTKEDVNGLISFIKEKDEKILENYPRFKLLLNLIKN